MKHTHNIPEQIEKIRKMAIADENSAFPKSKFPDFYIKTKVNIQDK